MSPTSTTSAPAARSSTCRAPTTEALEKAKTLPVDALIFDLEDAVAPDAKPAAREAACAAAASGEYGRRELTIRVNGIDTEWHERRPAGRVRRRTGRRRGAQGQHRRRRSAGWSRRRLERPARPTTPSSGRWSRHRTRCSTCEEIAAASERLTVLVMGTNDLVKELYAEHVPGRQPLLAGLGLCLLAARAAGTAILDGVYNDVKDTDGFLAECRQGRELGFDGKTLIHPGQVEGANTTFAPSEQAVDDARGILQAWEDGRGSGVVTYDGRMVENLHVESARRTLAMHDAIRALEAERA